MTCFWDGILQALDTSDFQIVGCNNRLNRNQLIDLLKNNNAEIAMATNKLLMALRPKNKTFSENLGINICISYKKSE